ncbi:anti-sigma factor [Aquipluma nitroreducens]|uniref:Anti-sigma factor n=1 Tax=Aquipluma nitroreducens TaxID=2010828 RepID=A0A5K7S5A7_9BACT|nr:FecR family protein [Aquipluma nitroreducens]BBE16534.1 anti-sigma factor [Aquipluma nitroreducens]
MEDKNYIYHLIALEFSNEMDSAQQHELQSWLKLSSENVAEYNEIIKVLTYYDALDAMKKIDVSHDLLLVKKKLNKHSNKNTFVMNFQKVAAILLLPLLIYTAWNISKPSTFSKKVSLMKTSETTFGVRSQIQLSDGTKVWINSGSKLTYPDEFTGKVREVKLEGEAYFQVESDKEHPFYVDLNGCKVKATGTRFNISNYKEDNEITTYLEHGKVSLLSAVSKDSNKSVQLNENEIIVYQKADKQYHITNADGKKYIGWIDGALIFKNDDTNDVAARLGRWFNAEIIFDEEVLKSDYVFTATFKHESLEEALRLLSYSTPITYKILSGSKQDDSSFSKRKVLISKK